MDRYKIQSLPKTKRVHLQTDENVDDPITGTDISPTSLTENVLQNCSKFQYLFDEFYKLLSTNGDKIMASCVTCHKKIFASTKSSGNLLSHIKIQHPVLMPKVEIARSKKSSNVIQTKIVDVKDLVFEYIVNEMRPLRTCEKESFKSLIVGLTGSNDAIVPSRKELSKQLDLKYELYVSMLTDLIAKQDYICAIADIWSVNNRSYMGMTCHFIDEETYFWQSYVIGCIRIKGSHNYQNITEVITEIAKTYKIDLSKITHVVTDIASNFVKAFRMFSSLPTHEASTSNLGNFDKNSSDSSNFDSGFDCSDLDSEKVNLNNLLNMESTLANDISKISNNDYNKISKSTFSKLSNFWNLASRNKLRGEKNRFLGYVAPTLLALRKLLIQSNQLTYCKPLRGRYTRNI
ncbi:hypothetical protein QTP88_025014 [Uroleucon formosanum]